MADKNANGEATATAEAEPEKTLEELLLELESKAKAGDTDGMVKLAQAVSKAKKAQEQAELVAKQAELAELTGQVKAQLDKYVEKLVSDGKLDKADGVWYSYNFGDKASSCKLMKSAAMQQRGAAGGGGGGKKFSIGWKELLERHGKKPYKETGMTCQAAWDADPDKNKRYAVREYMLKLEGLVR